MRLNTSKSNFNENDLLSEVANVFQSCLDSFSYEFCPDMKTIIQKQLITGEEFDDELIWQQVEQINQSILPVLDSNEYILKKECRTIFCPSELTSSKVKSLDIRNSISDSNNEFSNDEAIMDVEAGNSDVENVEINSDQKSIHSDSSEIIYSLRNTEKIDDSLFEHCIKNDLEKFLDEEDRKESLYNEGKSLSDEDDEDELIDDGNEDIKYEDFFDEFPGQEKPKKVVDIFASGENIQSSGENLSAHEMKLKKLKEKIAGLEDANIGKKPWQMLGEVTSSARPENCLLEEDLDFVGINRTPLVVSADVTQTLEEIIIQRIKDRSFDDVVRKVHTIEEPSDFRQKVILSQEKSKMSLAEIYEQEYKKQIKNEKVEASNPAHEELRQLMNSFFQDLDAMSHSNFVPKAPELKLRPISKLDALHAEEATQITSVKSTLAAPQEIMQPQTTELKGKSERTSTDKLRARRIKKLSQKRKANMLMQKLPDGSKKKALLDLKSKMKNSKSISMAKKSTSSVSDFFNQLQETVSNTKSSKQKTLQSKKSVEFKL